MTIWSFFCAFVFCRALSRRCLRTRQRRALACVSCSNCWCLPPPRAWNPSLPMASAARVLSLVLRTDARSSDLRRHLLGDRLREVLVRWRACWQGKSRGAEASQLCCCLQAAKLLGSSFPLSQALAEGHQGHETGAEFESPICTACSSGNRGPEGGRSQRGPPPCAGLDAASTLSSFASWHQDLPVAVTPHRVASLKHTGR